MMYYYEIEVEFIDGTIATIGVEAENEDEAIQKAMPISLKVSE